MKKKSTISGYNSPFIGFGFFLGKPRLWLVPLLSTLAAWFLLFCLFIFVAYHLWPMNTQSDLRYTLKVFQSLGVAAIVALMAWVFLIPFFLNICFEGLLKKVYLAEGDVLEPLSFFKTFSSGAYIFIKTLGWRIFWVFFGALMIVAFGPATLLIVQLGVAHIALIDGCDLSLSLKGIEAKQKLVLIRKNRLGILSGGCIAGLVSFFLMPTILIWLFWIPSIYVGAGLWVREWDL